MPSKTKKQYRFIKMMQNKYKSKEKAPNKYKWCFDSEWTDSVNYNDLPESVNENINYVLNFEEFKNK